MVNGYNSSVHSSYVQQGNVMPMFSRYGTADTDRRNVPAQNISMPPVNVAKRTYNTTVHQTVPGPQYNVLQKQVPQQPLQQNKNVEHTEEKENLLWKAIKNDKTAIAVGTVVSAVAILAMILSPKSVKNIQKGSKKCFIKRFADSVKTKWQNYRADYKARMAAKAPERNHLTPYLIT